MESLRETHPVKAFAAIVITPFGSFISSNDSQPSNTFYGINDTPSAMDTLSSNSQPNKIYK